MDEIGSRLSIVEHTQLEEQLFAVALLDRSGYQRVLHPNPRGGRDGGSDILVRFKRRLFAVAVAFFGPRTQSVDSRILSKFVEDLEKARKADRGSGFIFFTNAYVVDALRIKLVKLGLEEGFEVVEIFDHTWIRERLFDSLTSDLRQWFLGTSPSAGDVLAAATELRREGQSLRRDFSQFANRVDVFHRHMDWTLKSAERVISRQPENVVETRQVPTMTDVLKRFLDQARSPISREAQIFFAAIDEGAEVLRAELVVDVVEASTHDATFHLRYSVGERPIEVSFEWNEAVERELQRRRVRMSTLRAEALRGGILLVFALRSCDTQFGARFTNRVLRKVLFDQFSGFETIREIIGYLSDGMVAEQPEYRDCRNVIEAIIVEYQAHLKTLGYSSEDQTAVVVASLYFLVDMRTQVTLRKLIRSEP